MAGKQEDLDFLVKSIWNNIYTGIMYETGRDKNVDCAKDGKKKFQKKFIDLYHEISNKFMEDPTGALDRHKVAAIIMITIIDIDLLQSKLPNGKTSDNKSYYGKYILAMNSGLDYLLGEINNVLKKEKTGKQLSTYYFPKATSCHTDYSKIFFRNLYYAEKNYKLNPLDIAERLFLLEQLTFMKFDIDPSLFKEY